jgi:hypothetical protein
MPSYDGETPIKEGNDQYTYTFVGWTPELAAVTGNITYTATFTETVNEYTIRFVDEDGTELQSSKVAYGEMPAYTGETPTKKATAQYTYTFSGWSPELISVTGDATYMATYTSTVNEYMITFVNEDGAVLQGKKVAYGETPAYTGETPVKESSAQYTYTFAGWTPEIVPVTGEATYMATYSETVNEYTIRFMAEDGTELQTTKVAYGETPVYAGEMPTKPDDEQFTYTFTGWTPDIAPVTGDATYTAVFTAKQITGTLIITRGSAAEQDFLYSIMDGDGNVLMRVVLKKDKECVKVKGLPVGTYTVKEETSWSWRYSPDENPQTATISAQERTVTVTFREQEGHTPSNEWTGDIAIPHKRVDGISEED